MLSAFFHYWILRGEINASPMPPPRAAFRQPFAPFIYSLPELRGLLQATTYRSHESASVIDSVTLRTMLPLLYGTGARINEALDLTRTAVDLRNGLVTFHRSATGRTRTIPVGYDLKKALVAYENSIVRVRKSEAFFVRKDGQAIGRQSLMNNFKSLRLRARWSQGPHRRIPRLQDLRHTFAVHCLNAWIREGKDLRKMTPVLSAYMGFVRLDGSQAYLSMTPERFSKQLSRLANRVAR